MTVAAGRSRAQLVRRVAGMVLGAAVAVVAVLFVLGGVNPWQLVLLEYQFGNPFRGLLVVSVAGLVALWLALPVTDEARQGKRLGARVALAGVGLLSLILFGIFHNHFSYDTEELARTDDGTRAVVLVSDRALNPTREVRVWEGTGLATREVGSLGRVCGAVSARFLAGDRVEVESSYGTWELTLDPASGEPAEVLGPRCPDGPVPATLG